MNEAPEGLFADFYFAAIDKGMTPRAARWQALQEVEAWLEARRTVEIMLSDIGIAAVFC